MKIALTYTGTDEKHNNYVRWLKANEDIEVIKVSAEENNLFEVADSDALVLSGGRDIHPKYYNSQKTDYLHSQNGFDENRDVFEIAAFKLAREKSLPVLGICRGMQLVNSVLGGTLRQDLGEDLNRIHRVEAGNDKAHGITLFPHTMILEIAEIERSVVNSAHHQAIEKLGEGLMVNCAADDGTIEGLEWSDPSDKPFLLCVQWHPERMFKFHLEETPLSKNIRNKFIDVIQKSKEKK